MHRVVDAAVWSPPCTAQDEACSPQELTMQPKPATADQEPGVCMDTLLRLTPPHLEAAAWKSPAAARLVYSLDMMCLTNAVLVAMGLVSKFSKYKGTLTSPQFLHSAVYGIMAAVQLAVLLLQRQVYLRYRFKVTALNRLMRLSTATLSAIAWTHTDIRQWMPHMAIPAEGSSSSSNTGLLRVVLPAVLGLPVLFATHSNFVLQFVYVLPAQLVTLGANLQMLRTTACLMAAQGPGMLVVPSQLCAYLKLLMHYLSFQGQSPAEALAAAAGECQGLQGLVLLALYSNVVILLLLPCLTVYFIELNLKSGFIAQQQLVLSHACPVHWSKVCKVVVVYGAVVGSWMMCEVALTLLSPLSCDSSSVKLVFRAT